MKPMTFHRVLLLLGFIDRSDHPLNGLDHRFAACRVNFSLQLAAPRFVGTEKAPVMQFSWLNWLSFFILVLGLGLTVSAFDANSRESPTQVALLPQQIKSVHIDQSYSFAGEQLDMSNHDLRERLERELIVNAYYHSSTLLILKKARRFFPVIEPILAENGLPDDLKYLAVAESALANVTSPAGAKGFWQFMKPTAEQYGLEVNREVDERYHLEKATRAACDFLEEYYQRFGSWQLAAAGYNMGGTRLAKELELQRARRFDQLNLNPETARYLFRVLALKTIMEEPSAFGFDLEQKDFYAPLDDYLEVSVDTAVANWGDFARKYGSNYRALKIYNPWLITSKLTNRNGKTYQVRIPRMPK